MTKCLFNFTDEKSAGSTESVETEVSPVDSLVEAATLKAVVAGNSEIDAEYDADSGVDASDADVETPELKQVASGLICTESNLESRVGQREETKEATDANNDNEIENNSNNNNNKNFNDVLASAITSAENYLLVERILLDNQKNKHKQ